MPSVYFRTSCGHRCHSFSSPGTCLGEHLSEGAASTLLVDRHRIGCYRFKLSLFRYIQCLRKKYLNETSLAGFEFKKSTLVMNSSYHVVYRVPQLRDNRGRRFWHPCIATQKRGVRSYQASRESVQHHTSVTMLCACRAVPYTAVRTHTLPPLAREASCGRRYTRLIVSGVFSL